MKMTLEVTGASSGTYGQTEKRWARLQGRDHRGRSASAAIFGTAAKALSDEISRLVPEGEEIGGRRLLVELVGEWREDGQLTRGGKPVTRESDGSPVMRRTFFSTEFKVLTGPTLELARVKREADRRIVAAERMRADGEAAGAYRMLAEFVSMMCGKPFTMAADAVEGDDEEFGDGSLPPEGGASEDEVNPGVGTSVPEPVAETLGEAAPDEAVGNLSTSNGDVVDTTAVVTTGTAAVDEAVALPVEASEPEEAAAAAFAAADKAAEPGEAALREADEVSPRDVLDDVPTPVAAAHARFGMRRPAAAPTQSRPAPAVQPQRERHVVAQRQPERVTNDEQAAPPPRPRGLRPLGRTFGR